MDGWGTAAFAIFAALSAHLAVQFRRCFASLRADCEPASGGHSPTAQIIICLRGRDPFLARCLDRLARQDYPAFRITIVVDSVTDEAWPDVRRLLDVYGGDLVQALVRDRSLPECSRRASSLCTALDRFTDDVEIVALCDGDAVVHPLWLRQLVDGLQNSGAKVVSGNRWYSPPDTSIASHSRYWWNALAAPMMLDFGIPWAGSMAFHRSLANDPAFRTCLQHAFSEDTAIAGFLRARAQRTSMVPRLLVVNEEATTPRAYWNFLIRQMLAARLHHPDWPWILLHALAIGCAIGVLLPISIARGPTAALGALSGLGLFALTIAALTGLFERRLRRVLPERITFSAPLAKGRIASSFFGLVATAVIYPAAVIVATFVRRHEWRGVQYRIDSKGARVLRDDSGRRLHQAHELPAPAISPATPATSTTAD